MKKRILILEEEKARLKQYMNDDTGPLELEQLNGIREYNAKMQARLDNAMLHEKGKLEAMIKH